MRKFFIALFVFLLWCAIAFFYMAIDASSKIATFTSQLNLKKETAEKVIDSTFFDIDNEEILLPEKPLPTLETNLSLLHVYDKDEGYIFSLDSLYIKKNSDTVFLSTSKDIFFSDFLTHLESNRDLELIIDSQYSATENFNTPNIGIKRGEYLAKQLAALGVDTHVISIKSVIREIDFEDDEKMYGGILFNLKPMDEARKAEIEENRIITHTVYPDFTFASIIANRELKDFAKDLQQLFERYPYRKAVIIGHTDNIGSSADNYQLGLKYARQVRWYLINQEGFDASRLTAASQGDANPIDDNNTHTGRKNNLRIEFKIE